MSTTEHLLTCLAEECAEVAQRATKALRFGLKEIQFGQPLNNAARLKQEIHDLLAVVELLQEVDALAPGFDMNAIAFKKVKIATWLNYSKGCGTVDASTASEVAP